MGVSIGAMRGLERRQHHQRHNQQGVAGKVGNNGGCPESCKTTAASRKVKFDFQSVSD
jgi:hypothetical protein